MRQSEVIKDSIQFCRTGLWFLLHLADVFVVVGNYLELKMFNYIFIMSVIIIFVFLPMQIKSCVFK